MTSCEVPRIQISDPGELIDTVPYLLGFHPRESLVLVGFAECLGTAHGSGPQRIQVTVRVDLPDQLPDGLDAATLQPLAGVLLRADSAAMAAVLVTESVRGDPRQSAELVACRDLVAAAMHDAGIEILDVLVATERRWWSLCCEGPGCCPAAGRERASGCSPAAARATFAGLVALPDRLAMAATLAGDSAEQRSELLPRLAAAERRRAGEDPGQAAARRRAEVAELLAAAAAADVDACAAAGLTDEQLARHAVALTDRGVRDALWLALDDGFLAISQLMAELHGRVPAPYDAAPLFLFGWAQWRAGNATLATMAAERVLESEPGYSAAQLLLTAAQLGVDPRAVPTLSQAGG